MTSLTDDQHLKLYALSHGIRIDGRAETAWLERYGGPGRLVGQPLCGQADKTEGHPRAPAEEL